LNLRPVVVGGITATAVAGGPRGRR